MKSPFSSFWMAGYECSDQLNRSGNRVDLYEATGHLACIEEDYELINALDMATVREGLQWSRVEYRPYCYDWSGVKKIIEAADKKNKQVLWDLCHFGYPDDLSPLHPQFCNRFVAFSVAFVQMYRDLHPDDVLIVTPINEVSFISWLGGESGATLPYTKNYGWEVKYKLAQAYIQAVKSMKNLDSRLLILTTEPLINIIPDDMENESLVIAAREKNEEQFQVMDMLTGKLCPELEGDPSLPDIIGCNYYSHNQWFYPSEKQADWKQAAHINGYKSLSLLCHRVIERYGRPVGITETSFNGIGKSQWISLITDECAKMLLEGQKLWGVCIYPVLNRPDWDFPDYWHDSGIWEVNPYNFRRTLQEEYAETIKKCIRKLTNIQQHKPALSLLPDKRFG